MGKRINYKHGDVINGLVFIKEVEPHISPSGRKSRKALWKCFCGNEFESLIDNVKSGHTQSCGCYNKQRITKHGLYKHPLYKVWGGIIQRCYNPKHNKYKNYGGRGIKVCDEWKEDFKAFYDFAMAHGWKKGLEIDRINNDGDYEPNNCRFVSHAENNRNRRNNKLTKEKVRGIRRAKRENPKITLRELAGKYNIYDSTISEILNNKRWRNV